MATSRKSTENSNQLTLSVEGSLASRFLLPGKQGGTADDRYLWPEMLRIIKSVKPTWVVAENVPGIINMELDSCLTSLETEGYATGTLDISAAAVSLSTMERHIWIIAEAIKQRQERRENITYKDNEHKGKFQGTNQGRTDRWIISETRFCRVAERVSRKLDRNQRVRLQALGNAIVPQIAEEIGRMIIQCKE